MAANLARVEPEIRRVRTDDIEFLVALSQLVFRRYMSRAGANMMRMLRNPACKIAVAAAGDERLGFAVVHLRTVRQDFGPWSQPSVAHLDAIAVRPNVAGRGLGKRLLAHAEAIARSHGAVSMSLLTAIDNVRAKRLFDAAGYQLIAPFGDVYECGQDGLALFKALSLPDRDG
jgi:ribosomal protein S18 acetylase RimI-like enzyme